MAAPMDAGGVFPIKSKQVAVDLDGEATEVLCCHYEDYDFIIATQLNKMGTMVEVTRDVVLQEMSAARPSYTTRVLLGVDEPLTHVIAKNLLSKLDTTKKVLLSFSLKDNSPKVIQRLSDVIKTVVE
ncbi:proteasome assembly chaperone 3 isoform X1 [Magallana gigas]|uniref:Proteasome assembly chaperone 3 n=1 Tax=Magallana gigas TaxID=29159 RepID=A0A8W8M2V1_MAGGI|nr:proteasome assembly chaperone 3-like isoform X1 [Crassostrea gigas]|eukprot:XP_011441183.1 PREDICTED: proteasome assembly chaperone 3-like isoform X1 [Crassostrea gigas]